MPKILTAGFGPRNMLSTEGFGGVVYPTVGGDINLPLGTDLDGAALTSAIEMDLPISELTATARIFVVDVYISPSEFTGWIGDKTSC